MKSIRRKILSNIRDESDRTEGAYSSSKSRPSFCMYPFAIQLALNLSIDPAVCSFSYLTNPSSSDDVVVITKED